MEFLMEEEGGGRDCVGKKNTSLQTSKTGVKNKFETFVTFFNQQEFMN